MRARIDDEGRVVIPKELRELAGLEPRMEVTVECRDGRIEIEAALVDVQLKREGMFWVLHASRVVPMMTLDEVNALIDEDRARFVLDATIAIPGATPPSPA